MKLFNNLTTQENEALLKFPVYISMLAAFKDDKMDDSEKEAALKLSHIKTFDSNQILIEFYQEVDKIFEDTMVQLNKVLPIEKEKREIAIKLELSKIEEIVSKLDENTSSILQHSMKSYTEYVSMANHNILVDFIFPLPMEGINK